MTYNELPEILDQINCSVGEVSWIPRMDIMDFGFYIQLTYHEPDIHAGILEIQSGRKWYISSHATKSEVVQTVLKAALTSAEHMVREHFTYQNVRIFGPHFDVDDLLKLAQDGSLDLKAPKEAL
jgi:hypothetical protein